MSGTRLLSRKGQAIDAGACPAPRSATAQLPALLIVAHGERGGAGDDRLVHGLAGSLRGSGRYTSVRPCFISKEPSLKTVLAGLSPGPVLLYPLFMSDGYFVKRAIPKSLAAGTENDVEPRVVRIARPFGLSPHLPRLVSDLAMDAAGKFGRPARDCRLLLVAHGSRHDAASRRATLVVAQTLGRENTFAGIEQAFLEESPFLDDRIEKMQGPIIAVGLFIGQGMHGAVDLPVAIEKSGRSDIRLASPLARSPALLDVIRGDLELEMLPAKRAGISAGHALQPL